MKTGVMIVGARGATASTLIAAARLCTQEQLSPYLITEFPAPARLGLPEPRTFAFGGWDTITESWPETFARHGVLDHRLHPGLLDVGDSVRLYEAAALGRDHAVVAEGRRVHQAGSALLERLRSDIVDFKAQENVDRVVVVYMAAPALLPERSAWPQTATDFVEAVEAGVFETAGPYYVAAAILEGCAVIDYTASPTLEMPGLVRLAETEGVPLAGRDGSTGQTLLKSVLAEAFASRRLQVKGWYSSNILGNHDGFMLQDARYCDVKKVDKTALLEEILGYAVESHLVDIRFYKPAGDEKEAWDAIDFEGLMGCRGQLRVNWKCSDSLLAAPAILDLIRFQAFALKMGSAGIQEQLGVFFKFALGTRERRYLHLWRGLMAYCEAHAVMGVPHTDPPRSEAQASTIPST